MRPESAALLKQRAQSEGKDIPTSHCLPGGVPFSTLIAPFKMIQTPVEIIMLLEDNNPPRQIYTDGRNLPANPEPMWMGYSVGKWEGDTLVVDSVGLMIEPGSMDLVILTVNRCTSWSGSGVPTSVTWTSK